MFKFSCIFSWVITFILYFLGAEIVIAIPGRLIDILEVCKMNLKRQTCQSIAFHAISSFLANSIAFIAN